MSFFQIRKSEKNNAINRDVEVTETERIEDWIPQFAEEMNSEMTAFFGGAEDTRVRLVLQAIANCYGKMAVIVIHNNKSVLNGIQNIYGMYPEMCDYYQKSGVNVGMCNIDNVNLNYEPLYGLDEDGVVDAIYPKTTQENYYDGQRSLCAEALRSYCKILQLNSEIDIDGLIYLVNLDIEELEKYEMQGMSEAERIAVVKILTKEGVYNRVRADINAFAGELRNVIWREKEGDLSDVSMVKAVQNKAILTVQVPSNKSVLNYLATEVAYMKNKGMKFLLVLDSVALSQSLFNTDELLKAPRLSFSTVLSASTIESMFSDIEDRRYILSQVFQLIVLNCGNAAMAEVYSELIGKYEKEKVSTRMGQHKEDTSFFGGRDKGTDVHMELEYRITPDEFCMLREGAVLVRQTGVAKVVVKTGWLD